jgi:FkbM family methyltransferase
MLRRFDSLPDMTVAKQLVHQLVQQTIADPSRQVDKPLVLYGAGNLGRMAKLYCDRLGIDIEAVIDLQAERHRQDLFWQGLTILHPDHVSKELKQSSLLAVCVANGVYTQLWDTLTEQGWQDVVHFYDISEAYRDRHPLSNGWFCAELSAEDGEQILTVMNRWDDAPSRAYHLQFVAWRHLRQDWVFAEAEMQLDNRYLIPQVTSVIDEREVIADIGGHQGETTLLLLDAVNQHYQSLWIFEPDPNNLSQIKSNLATLIDRDNDKLHLFETGLSNVSGGRQFFAGAGYACQLTEIGDTTINVKTLDSFEIPATFMKLHLEGEELNVLQGAEKTLLKHRPIVASTAYHNSLGLYKMAAWLMKTLENYQFFFRMHSGCGTGAVIYAIPIERYQRATHAGANNES